MQPFNRAFTPLFITQFLGAFNDNLFKSALLVLIAFRPAAFGAENINGGMIGAIAAGLFIVPFFLFSATAGELADTRDKARMCRTVKTAEILLMLIAGLGFIQESLPLLLLALFGTGVQSAFFGPLKYAIIPHYVPDSALISANGWIETATFLAVLFGTIAGGMLAVAGDNAAVLSAASVMAVAIIGRISAVFLPEAPARRTTKPLMNPFKALPSVMRRAMAQKQAFKAIPFISWFWFLGATYLAQLPFYVRDIAGGDGGAVTLCLAGFSFGIAGGSLACEKLTKGAISLKAAPIAALVMGVGAIGLHVSGMLVTPPEDALYSAAAFFTDPARAGVLVSLAVIAAAGGVYIVPLYAVMQHYSSADSRSVVIAANNIVNALAMTVSAVAAAALTAAGIGIDMLFLIAGIGNLLIVLIFRRYKNNQ